MKTPLFPFFVSLKISLAVFTILASIVGFGQNCVFSKMISDSGFYSSKFLKLNSLISNNPNSIFSGIYLKSCTTESELIINIKLEKNNLLTLQNINYPMSTYEIKLDSALFPFKTNLEGCFQSFCTSTSTCSCKESINLVFWNNTSLKLKAFDDNLRIAFYENNNLSHCIWEAVFDGINYLELQQNKNFGLYEKNKPNNRL
jgi:hypothetical protein